MRRVTLSYFAGLFDGEGSILIIKQPTHTLNLKVTMTNEEVLLAVQAKFGGALYGPYMHKGQHNKPTWEWRVVGVKAYEVLKKLAPHLIVKREEAKCALDFGYYMYVWNKRHPRNQYNPITADEMADREIWRIALMGLKRGDLAWQN